ncbi:hypothetical protein VDGE_30583 [Verticillium dahliae]|uniref:Uncharacterized protein n=1 Tax=Verticillium dahliae TaxID=27337 RepID=A0A444RZE9_VERDA|nr:hypothetical protein VDGE_30583 [Verticillium dahliae]
MEIPDHAILLIFAAAVSGVGSVSVSVHRVPFLIFPSLSDAPDQLPDGKSAQPLGSTILYDSEPLCHAQTTKRYNWLTQPQGALTQNI